MYPSFVPGGFTERPPVFSLPDHSIFPQLYACQLSNTTTVCPVAIAQLPWSSWDYGPCLREHNGVEEEGSNAAFSLTPTKFNHDGAGD